LETTQESQAINQRAVAERAATKVKSENEIKRLDAELETQNIDERLFRAKAMDLAVNSLKDKYISSINLTALDETDAQSAMLAGLISKFTTTKAAVSNE